MQLVKPDVVLSRLGLSAQADDESFMQIVNDALNATTIYMEAQLETSFDIDAHTDLFYIDSMVYQDFIGMYRLKLSNGFVDGSTLSLQSTDEIFAASPDLVQLVANVDYLIDPKSLEKGFIDIRGREKSLSRMNNSLPMSAFGTVFKDAYIKVAYTSGFDQGTIPDWLAEGAIAHCINVMSWQQVGDAKPALSKVLEEVGKHKGAVLNRHMRSSSRAIPSIRST